MSATQKQRLSAEHWCELQNISDIVNLCAFAADSRRILQGIDEVKLQHPEVSKRINAKMTAPCNWDTYCDTLPAVLAHVNDRLQRLLNESEEE